MSYATIDELRSFIPKWRLAGDTVPSDTDATGFLTSISSRIDGVLAAQGISTPVTGSSSLAFVKDVCLNGAAWYVGRALFPGDQNFWKDFRGSYMSAMADLASGAVQLPDAGTSSSDLTLTAVNFDTAVASYIPPYFTRGMVF